MSTQTGWRKSIYCLEKYPGRVPGEKRIILKIKPGRVFYQKPPR